MRDGRRVAYEVAPLAGVAPRAPRCASRIFDRVVKSTAPAADRSALRTASTCVV